MPNVWLRIEEKIIPAAGIIFKNPFLSWVLKIKMGSYFFTVPKATFEEDGRAEDHFIFPSKNTP
jgi:hypothetical protein